MFIRIYIENTRCLITCNQQEHLVLIVVYQPTQPFLLNLLK
nr:MAG TPA: hypothetical protein [Crassvirales sp.]